ncbi:MAG: DNA polymerase III, partial [Bacteroidetes bacterium]|nr:DNA polymerase III [Bacteroidota bacterium]
MKPASNHPVTLQHNKELAAIFRHMADCYSYLGAGERFRARAYDVASKTLVNMNEPVDVLADDIKKLDELKGIGESIAEKIIEYLHTGKISTFEKLKKQVPYPLLQLLDIEGIGPATIRLLHDKLNVSSREELEHSIEQGKLAGIKGLAAKKIETIEKVFKIDTLKKRLPFKEAKQIAENVLSSIQKIKGVHKATIAGSIRREKETIGDIDIIITAAVKDWKKIISQITKLSTVEKVLAAGYTKSSVILKAEHIQLDVRIVHDDEYGAALFYFTGSKEHNIRLRTIARQKGWKINEYGVFDGNGKKIAGKTEEE